VLGCGNISDTYLTRSAEFDTLEVVACADLDQARAEAQAMRYGGLREPAPLACRQEQLTELWRGDDKLGWRCSGHEKHPAFR